MGLLKKIFKQESSPRQEKHEDNRSIEEKRKDPTLKRFVDADGEETFIDKSSWYEDSFPEILKEQWDNPDGLYQAILTGFNDGFYVDIIEAAIHLHKTDPDPFRGAVTFGIALMKTEHFDDAEEVLTTCLSDHGDHPVILINLAQVYGQTGQIDKSAKTLWRAIVCDPNQEGAVEWWAGMHHKEEGVPGYISALEQVASVSGSWKAQTILANMALHDKEYDKASTYYDSALSQFESVPAEAMVQITGDLGNAGLFGEIINRFAERFIAEDHGIMAGANLIKAYLATSNPEGARHVLSALSEVNRPEWKEAIDTISEQIAKVPDSPQDIQVTTLSLKWPVWFHKLSGSDNLLPAKEETAPLIAFISASCTRQAPAEEQEDTTRQKANVEGILSRSIPLLLAEKVLMNTSGTSEILLPIISGNNSFVMSPMPWDTDSLINLTQESGAAYIVNSHLVAAEGYWEYQATIIDAASKEMLDQVSATINSANPGPDIAILATEVMQMISDKASLSQITPDLSYRPPEDENLTMYLDGISQSLALTVAAAGGSGENVLYGEEAMFNLLLSLAENDTSHDIPRLMFLSALAKNKAYGSEIYLSFKDRVEALLSAHPLSAQASTSGQETVNAIYA